jgi:uncharacterized protein YecE (DUF72 family)
MGRDRLNPVRVGCSGWMYDDWRGRLYPEREPKRRWLELYAQRFDTVEVNSTFYRLPRREAVEGWVRQTASGFLFAVKASRYLTHVRRLRDISDPIKRFYEPLEPLVESDRLGPVLWQLPENFHRDHDRLEGLLDLLPEGEHTIEFRHESWFTPEVMAMLRAHAVALTIGDHPSRRFQSHEATAPWRFIRFHYGSRGRGGNYSAAELEQWAERISGWRARETVYAYFNNDWRGYAPANARLLLRRLGGATSTSTRTGPRTGRRPRCA